MSKYSIHDCRGFAVQKYNCGWEGKCLFVAASLEKVPCRLFNYVRDIPSGWVPYGSVQWTSQVLGYNVVPNYYPDFLRKYITRNIRRTNEWTSDRTFIKPADAYKRFDGFVSNGPNTAQHAGPFWCSDVVSFVNEWRYYVCYGELIGAYWYKGEQEEDAPVLDIKWPSNWCGVVDFGRLDNGRVELIEAHHPFSCGWYGTDPVLFAAFVMRGWQWLTLVR